MKINKLKISIFCIFIISFISFSVISADFNDYLDNDLEGKSNYYMSGNTKKKLRSYYKNDVVQIHGAALNAKHANFDNNKNTLIQEWEQYSNWPNPANWPTYAMNTGNRNAGDRYDAHHIIPQSHNGPNEWWNLFPLTNAEHHQIHSNGTNCSQLFPGSRGQGRDNENYLP